MDQLWIYLGIGASVITVMIIAMYKAFVLPEDIDPDTHYAADEYDQYHTIEYPRNYN